RVYTRRGVTRGAWAGSDRTCAADPSPARHTRQRAAIARTETIARSFSTRPPETHGLCGLPEPALAAAGPLERPLSRGSDRRHRAGARELNAFVHEDLRRVQGPADLRRHVKLDRLGGANIGLNGPALDDHGAHLDLGLDLGPLSDDEHVRAADLPPKRPVDAQAAFE